MRGPGRHTQPPRTRNRRSTQALPSWNHGSFVVREELEIHLAMRHTRERLRRPAAGIDPLARGYLYYMASRRIAPTTALRASARG